MKKIYFLPMLFCSTLLFSSHEFAHLPKKETLARIKRTNPQTYFDLEFTYLAAKNNLDCKIIDKERIANQRTENYQAYHELVALGLKKVDLNEEKEMLARIREIQEDIQSLRSSNDVFLDILNSEYGFQETIERLERIAGTHRLK